MTEASVESGSMIERVASVWLLRGHDTVLLQHRDDIPEIRHADMWAPPGGHAEPGESMLDCAKRELEEETEYDAPHLEFLDSFSRVHEDGTPYEVSYFWCRYDEVQTIVCHEGQEMRFIERSAAEDYPIPVHLFDAWDTVVTVAGENEEQTN